MTTTQAASPASRAARELLTREYEPLKEPTLRALRAKLTGLGLRLPDEDLEAFYNQAWHAIYDRLAAGGDVDSPSGFLVEVGFRRAIDHARKVRPDSHAELVGAERLAAHDDIVDHLDDRRQVRELVEALREELDERERAAASLCYLHGYSRREAAELMGIREARLQKIMDSVSKSVARVTAEIRSGTRCEGRTSLNKAYALGLLDPEGERREHARAHLDECPSCRADVLRMRGLAVIAPPALLPWAALRMGGGAGAAAGGAGSTGSTGHAGEAGAGAGPGGDVGAAGSAGGGPGGAGAAAARSGRFVRRLSHAGRSATGMAAGGVGLAVVAVVVAVALTRGSDAPQPSAGATPPSAPATTQPATPQGEQPARDAGRAANAEGEDGSGQGSSSPAGAPQAGAGESPGAEPAGSERDGAGDGSRAGSAPAGTERDGAGSTGVSAPAAGERTGSTSPAAIRQPAPTQPAATPQPAADPPPADSAAAEPEAVVDDGYQEFGLEP
jgi:RNA polymerase sigma factor (sigma-70 family)